MVNRTGGGDWFDASVTLFLEVPMMCSTLRDKMCDIMCASVFTTHVSYSPLCGRYTNPGDTVLSLSAEKHSAVEVALGRGRRVEVFVSNVAAKEGVKERIKESFRQAYKNGMFKVKGVLMDYFISPLGCRWFDGVSSSPAGVPAGWLCWCFIVYTMLCTLHARCMCRVTCTTLL